MTPVTHLDNGTEQSASMRLEESGTERKRVTYTVAQMRGIISGMPATTPDFADEVREAVGEGIERKIARWNQDE